jgi:hypothetical protein
MEEPGKTAERRLLEQVAELEAAVTMLDERTRFPQRRASALDRRPAATESVPRRTST